MQKLQHVAFVRHIPGIYNLTWTDIVHREDIHAVVSWTSWGCGGCHAQTTIRGWRGLSALPSMGRFHKMSVLWATLSRLPSTLTVKSNVKIKWRQTRLIDWVRNTLDVCIYPLDDVSHPDGALINIITGQIADPDGKASCRNGCEQKHVLVGTERVYDQGLFYACVIGLLAS